VHPCVFGVMEVKNFEIGNGPNSMCCETFGGVSSVTKRGSNWIVQTMLRHGNDSCILLLHRPITPNTEITDLTNITICGNPR
jgi:hypothetical protein